MARTAFIRARVEPGLKHSVEKLLGRLGLTASEAINVFYRQINLRKGLPFDVALPNEETRSVFADTDAGRNLVRCKSSADMFKRLGI